MRNKEPGLITGHVLHLSVPLGWRLCTYKSSGVRNRPGSSDSEVLGIEQVRRRENGVLVKHVQSREEPVSAGVVCRCFLCRGAVLVLLVKRTLWL